MGIKMGRLIKHNKAQSKIRIGILIPSAGAWESKFGLSLLGMSLYVARTMPEVSLSFHSVVGSQVGSNRENLLKQALDRGYDYVLWLDDDMTFPKDTLTRLLKHRKNFVGAQGVTKSIPADTTAVDLKGHDIPMRGRSGIEEINHVGLAVVLVDIRQLDIMPQPRFVQQWSKEAGTYGGEDVYFCLLLKQLGMHLWLDHDLSKEIGHVGRYEYSMKDTPQLVEEESAA